MCSDVKQPALVPTVELEESSPWLIPVLMDIHYVVYLLWLYSLQTTDDEDNLFIHLDYDCACSIICSRIKIDAELKHALWCTVIMLTAVCVCARTL